MKKILAWVLIAVMLLGIFAGCKKQEDPTEPTGTTVAPNTTEPTEAPANNAADVVAYLKAIYKDGGAQTPVDYKRFGIVRIAGVPYEVVWTTDLSEDLIKVVVNDDGTVTIDVNEKCETETPYVLTATVTDENGNTESCTWNYVLPEAVDMVSIVKLAYALASGESLPYESTLTGKITSVKTPYDPSYKNVTVIIEVEGAENMPIECYRLKGEGADKLAIGDTITVTGTLKNYNGTIEFDAGCSLDAVTPGERVEAPTDPKQIVREAYALGANKSLPYEATLTGTITKVGTPYDSAYGNVTVTIVVDGMDNYPIVCYRMKGDGADKIGVNDKITVRGYITNYVGSAGYSTIEYTAGCQLLSWEDRAAPTAPSDQKLIVDEAYALAPGASLKYEATLTGKITKVNTPYDAGYDNVTVTIVVEGREDKPIKVYRLKGNGNSKIGVGDTITVKGYIINYQHSSGDTEVEFNANCQLLSWQDTGSDEVVTPNVPELDAVVGPLTAGVAYKMYLGQANLGKIVYFSGSLVSDKFLTGSTKVSEAVDVFVEDTTGGVYFYFMNGETKTYFVTVDNGADNSGNSKAKFGLSTEAGSLFTYDEATGLYLTAHGNGKFFAGTYNDFTTFSLSSTYYITGSNAATVGVSQFVAKFVESSKAPTEDIPDEPEQPEPEQPGNSGIVEAPVAGTAYKFGMIQQNVSATDVYYLIGGMDGYYMATGKDATAAIDVYLEETAGGYYLYTLEGETKTYINMVVSGTHVNGAYEATASTVYTYDETSKTIIAMVNDAPYWFGTRNDKEFTTVGPCATSFNGFYCQFYSTTPEQPEPEQPEVTEPTVVDVPVVGTAYKFGMIQQNVSATDVYYLIGGMDGYYMATGKDTAAAIDVYLEETEGGYYLYTLEGETKTYINMVVSGTHVNGAYEATASTVYTYDETSKTIIAMVNDAPYWFGTRNDKEFTTVGPCATSYNGFYCQFYTVPGSETPDQPEQPEPEQPEVTEPTVVDVPVVGTAYKFGMIQQNVSATDVYYLIGGMDGYYMATGKDATAAIDVYLEETEGGYYLYTLEGETKTYINMVVSGTHVNGAYEATASTVYTYDETSKTIIAMVNDAPYWFGTRNDKEFTTVGPCATSYNGFYCQFYAVPGSTTPEQPEPEQPEVTEPTVVDVPVVGTAYKFGMIQQNVSATDVYYLIGGMDGYYMATGKDTAAAIDVYLEETEGGYYLYTLEGETKTYINMVVSGTHVNGAYEATASTVYTYDETSKTIIAMVNDAPYWFGTRNDKEFTTVGPCATSYNGFYCQFYTVPGSETPDQPEQPEEPEQPEVPTVSKVDFNTIQTTSANGDSSYTKTFTTESGWIVDKSAIQTGGVGSNPQFTVIGPDNTHKAVCLNGKTSAPGSLTSPTLTGGLSKINMTYTKVFSDKLLSVTFTVTELATGNTYTHTVARDVENEEKYTVWTEEWVLETPVTGDFTIAVVNDCPSGQDGNKDRFTILELAWETAGKTPTTPEEPEQPEEPETPKVVSIATAVAGANDTEFKVKGVITCVDGKTIYIMDATGGMGIYFDVAPSDLALGETIEASGIRSEYSGLPQLKNASYMKTTGETLTAKETTIGALTTADIGTYVEIKDLVVESLDSYGNPFVKDAEGKTIKIHKAVKPDGLKVGDTITVKASVGVYNSDLQLRNTKAEEITITATAPEEGGNEGGDSGAIGEFVKVTSAEQLTTGQYVMIVNTGYAPSVEASGWLSAVQPVVEGNKVTDTKDAVWTLTVDGSSVTLADPNGTLIGPKGGNNNGIKTGTAYKWAWSFENGTFKFAGIGSDTVALASNTNTSGSGAGNHRFRGYKTTTISGYPSTYPDQFTLYKLIEG